jgi:hypothetical protein
MALRAALATLFAVAAAISVSAQETLRLDADAYRSGLAPDGSVDRVRAALQKPPSKLTLIDRQPDFTVHIEKKRPMQDIFEIPPWQLPPIGWQPPAWGTGINLLSLVQYVAKSVADAKRGHDERVAREDVQRDIADYCAAQPNRATIQICSNAPSGR